ncbi:MAG: Gfo/Idh/MocA family oxidoreductase [candidate division Zixibacteria bacterium]|nr:Gfo/Idh/MocA family oxidoreductase [candidate division Zixibacteria bacterium]
MENIEKQLRLGIIGMSEGNGHPYSWSAIFNGYDPEAMQKCPFPVIPEYLSRQTFPDDAIPDARVTHLWTQNKDISKHIASASLIKNVVDNYADMIGQVDAVLLARDDPENHKEMSRPFLEVGLPIYIDKPLALSVAEAKNIYSYQKYDGQIFTCSALRFADEFNPDKIDIRRLGTLVAVKATIMKDWQKYGVHIIEPVLKIIGDQGIIKKVDATHKENIRTVVVNWNSGLKTTFKTTGNKQSKLEINLEGTKDSKTLTFGDTFSAFKNSLKFFVKTVRSRQGISKEFVLRIVDVLEKGEACVKV